MGLIRFLAMLLVTNPGSVVLLVCIDVGGCLCPIIYNAWRALIAYRQLINRAPGSASAVEDMTALIIWDIVMTSPFFDGMDTSSDMKKCPPDLLLTFVSER